MPDRPSDVRKKLDELYHKTEDIRRNLIEIHHLLTSSGYFESSTSNQQQQSYAPPVAPSVQAQHLQPVVPPAVQQVHQQPAPAPPNTANIPKKPAPPEKGFFERHPDLEKFIGERLVTFIGIAILVTGIAFFVKYAIDRDWINETGRTLIGILCGGILIGVAHRLRKTYLAFSVVLAAGGVSVFYFTISYAFQVYHLFPQSIALLLLIAVTLFTVMIAIVYDRKDMAILALVGGFASPLMIKTGEGNFIVLCIYMLILDAGMMVLAYYKKWNIVNVLAFAFTTLFYTVALLNDISDHPHVHDHEAFLFVTLFYFVFFAMNIVNNLREKRKFDSFGILSLLFNTGLYYTAGYFLLQHMDAKQFTGLFTLAVATFNFIFAYGLFRKQAVDRNLVYVLVGIVITFVSLAGPVQLNGNHITLLWAAEAVVLLWLYQKTQMNIIRTFSIILNVVALISVGYNWMNVYFVNGVDLQLITNKGLITTLGAVISLSVSSALLLKSDEQYISGTILRDDYRKLLSGIAVCILYIGGFLEITHQVNSAGYSHNALAIIGSTYTVIYLIAAWFSLAALRMEFFRWTIRIGAIALLIIAAAFPHLQVAAIRNSWLSGEPQTFGPFMLHYLYAGLTIGMGYIIIREASANENMSGEFRTFLLWLFCASTVFLLSAELDHSMVMAYCYNPQNPAWRIADVPDNIAAGLAMSHKVGFPIIWGICSFAMMVIGMKKKNRQLRIISLVLFFITVVKLILLGVYGESQTGKIVAFILCGVILLLVSFMYQKLKKLIMEDGAKEEASGEKVA